MGIVTEATSPAGRVYRSLGFEPDTGTPRRTASPRAEPNPGRGSVLTSGFKPVQTDLCCALATVTPWSIKAEVRPTPSVCNVRQRDRPICGCSRAVSILSVWRQATLPVRRPAPRLLGEVRPCTWSRSTSLGPGRRARTSLAGRTDRTLDPADACD